MKCCVCGKELDGLISMYVSNWKCSNCEEDKTDVLHCEKGCKVTVSTFNAGYEMEKKTMEQLFKIGEIYTIDKVVVGSFYSNVYLMEFPGKKFNSVFFRRVV